MLHYNSPAAMGEDGRAKMSRNLRESATEESEELVGRTIDRRFEVWLTQLMDDLEGTSDESGGELRAEFAASLRRSLEQASAGEGTILNDFRRELGR